MDLNRIYSAVKLYEEQDNKDITEVAAATGLTESIITDVVINKKRYRGVLNDYKRDCKVGETTEYKEVKPKKLDQLEYNYKRQRQTMHLLEGNTLEEVESYLQIDDVPDNQIQQLLKDIQKDVVVADLERKHRALTDIERILKLPIKWSITGNAVIEIYPKPVIKGGKVVGVEYTADKNYLLPDQLLEAFLSYSYQRMKFIRGDQDHDLSYKEQATVMLALEYAELKEQGYTAAEIATKYAIKTSNVTTVLRSLRDMNAKKEEEREAKAVKDMLSELDKKKLATVK